MANQPAAVVASQLLLNVAEELKLPLLAIAREAEAGQLAGQLSFASIQQTAETALRLLDHYALGVRLNLEPGQLVAEPVSIASILYDSCQQLDGLAKSYGVSLHLNIAGRFEPVMAHRQGLQAALVSLGAGLIEALPALDGRQLSLQLATHRCRYGIVAGLYTDNQQLTNRQLAAGRQLMGQSRQPLVNLTHTSGAGIFVADSILRAMRLRLRASRHHGLYGLGAILQPNYQLQLV